MNTNKANLSPIAAEVAEYFAVIYKERNSMLKIKLLNLTHLSNVDGKIKPRTIKS